jgi:hypothetical protein
MPTSSVYRTAAAAAVAVGSLTFFGASAGAQTCYPPTPGCLTTTSSTPTTRPALSLSATTVVRGQRIVATVSGFQPSTSGIITIASVEQQIGAFTMPASGPTSTTVTIPATISLGTHTVFARGTAIGGQPGSASQGVIVVASGTPGFGTTSGGGGGTLARTGVALGAVTIVGAGLVLGGMALKRSGKRGRANNAA